MQHAANGIYLLLRSEPNAKIHLLCATIVICLSFYIGLSTIEWAFIGVAIGIVFISETFNSAIENLCDIISTKYDVKIKVVKDLGAGAVLISAITAVVIACFILIPKLLVSCK
jgi:diacylglycerol kinase